MRPESRDEDAGPQKRAYRVADLVEVLGVPRSTIYHWLWQRVLPHVRIGRVRLVLVEDLEAFLQRHRIEERDRGRPRRRVGS